MRDKKGFFVVIEGGDGCGKSTLLNNLKNSFPKALFTREPGGTSFGEKVRELIFESEEISKLTEMYLFCASRSELIKDVIKPALKRGELIICDRFVHSSYVYQGLTTNVGYQCVKNVNSYALQGVVPDLVIYLKVEKCFRQEIENRLDNQTQNERDLIYKSYNMLADANEQNNIYTLNVSNKTPDQVLSEAIMVITEKMNER